MRRQLPDVLRLLLYQRYWFHLFEQYLRVRLPRVYLQLRMLLTDSAAVVLAAVLVVLASLAATSSG